MTIAAGDWRASAGTTGSIQVTSNTLINHPDPVRQPLLSPQCAKIALMLPLLTIFPAVAKGDRVATAPNQETTPEHTGAIVAPTGKLRGWPISLVHSLKVPQIG